MNQKTVTIYTTPTCSYCRATKELFQQHQVAYTEVDVSQDQAKAREMIQKSGQMGVPVIMVGEGTETEIIVGYDRARLATALNLSL